MRLQNRRVLGSAALAVTAALVVAGCGAGQITQTDTEQPAVNGAHGAAKAIQLRDAAVVSPPAAPFAYPAGANAPLSLTIVNTGLHDDQLVSVTSDGSGPATINGSRDVVGGHSLVIGPIPLAGGAEPGARPSAPQAPTSSITAIPESSTPATPASPSGSPQVPTTPPGTPSESVAPGGTAQGAIGRADIVLTGLESALWAGQTINVTFTFRDAGPVTIALPVAAPAVYPGGADPHTPPATTPPAQG